MINAIRVGWFLAWRQLKRSNPWTNLLITFIMTLTFFNLVAVSGILVGLIEGSSVAFREQYSGDVLVANLQANDHIEESRRLIDVAKSLPGVDKITGRYIAGVTIESGYEDGRSVDEGADRIGTQVAGINPDDEHAVTGLWDKLIEGRKLEPDDTGVLVMGKGSLDQYNRGIPGLDSLEGVEIGKNVLVTIGDIVKEYKVVGIVGSKIETVDFRVFLPENELRQITQRDDFQMDEIAIVLNKGYTAEQVQAQLKAAGFDRHAKIQTWEEAQGTFFKDIKTTFNMLGSLFGAVGLMVASITVFIVIFINAVTRQRFIGILKAVGIQSRAIVVNYVIQSIVYGVVGSAIGFALVYGLVQPYIDANPIDFPFSDGILSAPLGATMIRFFLLMFATIIAGYIPARMIAKKPALDSLLGR